MERLSPALFYMYAKRLILSYDSLIKEKPRFTDWYPVNYFLLSRGIELAMKAVLVQQGYDEGDLKKIGHDLDQIARATCIISELKLTKKDNEVIGYLNPNYYSKLLEYPKVGTKNLPGLPETRELAGKCLQFAEEFVNIGRTI